MTRDPECTAGRFETIHGRVVLLSAEQGGRTKGSPAQWPGVAWRPQAYVAGTSDIEDLADCSVVFESEGPAPTNTAWFGWLRFGPTEWPRIRGVRVDDLLVLKEGSLTVGYLHVDAVQPSAHVPAIRYQRVTWMHTTDSEHRAAPRLLYSEIISDRETRKVVVFEDGRTTWADAWHESDATFLRLVNMPTLDEVNAQEQFDGEAIPAELFEAVWQCATSKDEPLRLIGYWAAAPPTVSGMAPMGALPDPQDWINPTWDSETRDDVVDHLQRGALRRQFVAHVYTQWEIREVRRASMDWWRDQRPPGAGA